MKTVIIIQARTGSSRLPNKVLMPLAGAPLLQRMVERVRCIRSDASLIVATTTDVSDEPIRMHCRTIGVECFSGHPTDLLDRHYQAALTADADAVVKIPSDCPLIDPSVIDRVLKKFRSDGGRFDFVSNLHPATYPDGNDVEVMTMASLEMAWKEARKEFEREHTTPYLWDNPDLFRIGNVEWETGLDLSMSHRWTIDYPEDYAFLRAVYDSLWTKPETPFTIRDILRFLGSHPEIHAINSRFAGVNWYRHHLGEFRTVQPEQTRQLL